MKHCIAFSGWSRVGKDTAGQALAAREWTRVAFADPVRDLAIRINPEVRVLADFPWPQQTTTWFHLFREHGHKPLRTLRLADLVERIGWEDAKQHPEVTRLLIDIGMGVRDIVDRDAWARLGLQRARDAEGNVYFTDLRFRNEAHLLRRAGAILVRLESPRGVRRSSDGFLDDYDRWDYIIQNNGTIEELHGQIATLAASLVDWTTSFR